MMVGVVNSVLGRVLRRCASVISLALIPLVADAAVQVVHNVHGYTPTNEGLRAFSGLVIVDGKIERVLTSESEVPRNGEAIDGGGRTLLPGLIDAHGHVLWLGEERLQADLRGSTSLQETLDRTRSFAAAHADSSWVMGRGWDQELWADKRFPTARDLDRVIGDRPAMLTRIDLHVVWVNSAALKLAGISSATVDPPGGQIVRDATGQPTGVFVDAAMALIKKHLPERTDEGIKHALRTSMRELVSLGLTGTHDAGIDSRQYRLYQELGARGELPLRIYAMLAAREARPGDIEAGPRSPQFDDRLQMPAVKVWVDGALGSRGAALLQDYSDEPHSRGLMLYTPAQLQALAKLTSANGWQLNVHAIGDAGNRFALDTFEKMLTREQRRSLRPRIEHASVLTPGDVARFAKLGIVASIQPMFATSDMSMAEDRLGPTRVHGAYAWRTLLDAGVRLAGGSDFPVELPNPFLGMYAAVTRQDREGRPAGGWHPREKLSREEALRLFTADAAYAARMENVVGTLEPGKWADFILIDRDYFKVPEQEIDDIRVLATFVAGSKVSPQ